jgi:hypothetical protein
MKIYYEFDPITDNCKNKCPFESVGVKGESGPNCQVGSVTCQECKFCYGHHNTYEYSCLHYDNELIFTPMPYIKCMYGKDNPWKERIIQFFYRIKQRLKND